MGLPDPKMMPDTDEIGQRMYHLISRLYPICRSITGNGVRETFGILRELIPLDTHEIPSGTQVFDWTIPKEWNIRDAYVKDSRGEKIIDFQKSNLHVMSYSVPIKKDVTFEELKAHLFTIPEHPEWVPYRTSYYKQNWGFCLSHKAFLALLDGTYEVYIDSSLEDGYLTYGEYYLPGETDEEILLSCHICHPSLCNDNLSGVALITSLAKHLSSLPRRYSYRFLFIPGTIGAISWLCLNETNVSRIKHGLVLAGVGDAGKSTYKRSRRGNAEVDRAVAHVLRTSGQDHDILDFSPYGYDERQFCSPGFNLPVGCLMRTPHGCYAQYHTSADDVNFVQPRYLADSFAKCFSVLHVLDNNKAYLNQNPRCEPQLGKRGLYRMTGGYTDGRVRELAMLWVLNLSDGGHSLLDIAERAGLEFRIIKDAADALSKHGLLKEYSDMSVKSLSCQF
jgi:aminopeptidase-like protein